MTTRSSQWVGWVIVAAVTLPLHAGESTMPSGHPRLLLHREDVDRLRVECGIEGYHDDPVVREQGIRYGSQRAELDMLRQVADAIMPARLRSDDLFVPALLHLVTGEFERSDRYTECVVRELLAPDRRAYDLDAVVALDHCWDAMDGDDRLRIVERLAATLEPLEPGENPLNYYGFHRKLASLAGAIVLHGERSVDGLPGVVERVARVLESARGYFDGPFIRFCQQRGSMPTSSGNAPWEEASLVLATEIWRTGMGHSLWPELADSLGHACHHYFYADTNYTQLTHGFIHDDGSHVPLAPGQIYRGFLPAAPWAIARHTSDPIATWYANRSLATGPEMTAPELDRYQWVRLLYGPLEQAEAARRACPMGWHFGGGWVAMRSGWDRGETVVLFDVGQPYWRSRQHFDAGQFQIYRKGRLAIDSGDDVTYEAVPTKGGQTTLGTVSGDWDAYFQATIAHNCVTVSERVALQRHYGRPWPALGNQRLIERDYDLSVGDIAATHRHTGRLTAFETNSFYSYAAADLAPAYSPDLLTSYTRQLLFVHEGALLVLDRLETPRLRSIKTWHLQLPVRPRLAASQPAGTKPAIVFDRNEDDHFADLGDARQLYGLGAQAGIWEMWPAQRWLEVTQGHGRLFVCTLLPGSDDVHRRVIGGPMEARQILSGSSAGRSYYGGDPMGYEHRLWPAALLRSPNAAYTLTQPTGLGPDFGVGATWGRLDVFPVADVDRVTFLHLLIPTDKAILHPPPVSFERQDELAVAEVQLLDQDVRMELTLGDGPPGKVVIRDRAMHKVIFEKSLTAEVRPNLPIPGSSAPSPPAVPR